MLGFGKKKQKEGEEEAKKDTTAAPTPKPPEKKATEKGTSQPEGSGTTEEAPPSGKKKFITKKKIIILFFVLGAIGASAFLVYKLYFTEKGSDTAIYNKIELTHVNLPEEMLRFSFEHFPDLYISLVNFNTQTTLFSKEIARIEGIAQKYPEQQKITYTEKKLLEKGKNTLAKVFSKLEKPIKETYVLFQVNEAQGLAQIKEKEKDLTNIAQAALKTAQEQTEKFTPHAPQVPDGIFQGILYKLKKKFL